MPQPIVPVRNQDMPQQLFDPQYGGDFALSALQSSLLGVPEKQIKEASKRLPEPILEALDSIYKHEDPNASAFNQTVLAKAGTEARVFGVPQAINDNQLLQMKAAGLLTGAGRKVSFTERGRRALAEKWMASKNALSTDRQYFHPNRTATAKGNVRTAATVEDLLQKIEELKHKFDLEEAPRDEISNGPLAEEPLFENSGDGNVQTAPLSKYVGEGDADHDELSLSEEDFAGSYEADDMSRMSSGLHSAARRMLASALVDEINAEKSAVQAVRKHRFSRSLGKSTRVAQEQPLEKITVDGVDLDTLSHYHGGQTSAIYSFTSTGGTIHSRQHGEDLLDEIEDALEIANSEYPEDTDTLNDAHTAVQKAVMDFPSEEEENENDPQPDLQNEDGGYTYGAGV
jgi:hypothetical protein